MVRKIARMDVFSRQKRSEVMSHIRGRGNRSTERALAALLRAWHISGWTLHSSVVSGCPDIYFPHRKIAIFVDGCFWHACPKCFRMPAHNRGFWKSKILRNIHRDRSITYRLRRQGIRVVRIWEHDVEKRTSRLGWLRRELHDANVVPPR